MEVSLRGELKESSSGGGRRRSREVRTASGDTPRSHDY